MASLRPSDADDYIQGGAADNGNPFVAARQRLKQQQLQYERAKYKYYADNNEHRAYDLNNINNNMAYSAYLQQQQQQRQQNELASMAKANMGETQAKASAEHESERDDLPRVPEEEAEKAAAKKKSDLTEIFGDYQHAANSKDHKTNLRGDYKVSNGESPHNGMSAPNEM